MGRQDAKNQLIYEVLEREWEMFQSVKSALPASCQRQPDTFRKIRGSIFQFWPQKLLSAYLTELTTAKRNGRNLFTEKYARMDNLIPPLNKHPLLDEIVKIETEWQDEVRLKYPALYSRTCRSTDSRGDGMDFSVYIRCELETYGNNAIEIYYEWVAQARRNNSSYSLPMLNQLVIISGFKNIDEAEFYYAKRFQA